MDFGREQLEIIEKRFGPVGKIVSGGVVYVLVGATVVGSLTIIFGGLKVSFFAIRDLYGMLFAHTDPVEVVKGIVKLAAIAAAGFALWRYILSPVKRREEKRVNEKVQEALEAFSRMNTFIESLALVLEKHQGEIPDWLRNADLGAPLTAVDPEPEAARNPGSPGST